MKKLLIAAMTLATLFVAAPQPASAFPGGSFLITCRFVTFGEFDPLTGAMSHEHTFAGNLGVQMNSTKQQLLSQSTNCSDSKDHTAYWIPTFTKNGTRLQPYQVNAYYVGRGVNRVAFPDGYVVKSSDVRYACSNNSSGSKNPINCGKGTAQFNVTFFSGQYPEVHMMFKFSTNSLIGAKASSDMMGDPRHGDMFPAFDSGHLEQLIRDCLNAHKTCGRIKG
ncbi:MAG: DUF1996 domain-containing protein [Actinomycetota bacterium]